MRVANCTSQPYRTQKRFPYETYHVGDVIQTGNPLHIFIGDTGRAKDGRRVDGDSRYPDPFLHDLQPNDELDTTTSVEFARADTEQHGKVRLGLRHFPLQFGDVPDVLEFGFGLANVLARFSTKAAQNVPRFILAAHLHEPTGGLGEDPNDCQEEDEWENLECNWEAPDEGTVTTCVVLASTSCARELMAIKTGVIMELTIRANMPRPRQRC